MIGDDFRVRPQSFGRLGVKVPDYGYPLTAAGEDQGALPGEIAVSVDEGQDRVAHGGGLAYKSDPGIHLLLFENAYGLVHLLLNE